MYHLVCPAKYRKAIFTDEVDLVLKNVCEEISKRYEIAFIEIGTDKNHVHFLIQSVPMYSPKKIAQIVNSITAREVFKKCPFVKNRQIISFYLGSIEGDAIQYLDMSKIDSDLLAEIIFMTAMYINIIRDEVKGHKNGTSVELGKSKPNIGNYSCGYRFNYFYLQFKEYNNKDLCIKSRS